MRQFLPTVLSLLLVRFQFAQIESVTGVVAPGTGVEIELLESVSSESLHAGQNVPFKLVRRLEANGVALLAAGTPVQRQGHESGRGRPLEEGRGF